MVVDKGIWFMNRVFGSDPDNIFLQNRIPFFEKIFFFNASGSSA